MSAQPGSDKTISADDGGKRARSPGRARNKPLNPLRAGMPGDPGGPVVATLVCNQHFAHEAAGAAGTRHSPRPQWGREIFAWLGRIAPRDREVASDDTSAPHSQPSSPAKAGDPVFRGVSDGIAKPRRTGYPACAGSDGLCVERLRRRHCEPTGRMTARSLKLE